MEEQGDKLFSCEERKKGENDTRLIKIKGWKVKRRKALHSSSLSGHVLVALILYVPSRKL
jgi:hypothetical protein